MYSLVLALLLVGASAVDLPSRWEDHWWGAAEVTAQPAGVELKGVVLQMGDDAYVGTGSAYGPFMSSVKAWALQHHYAHVLVRTSEELYHKLALQAQVARRAHHTSPTPSSRFLQHDAPPVDAPAIEAAARKSAVHWLAYEAKPRLVLHQLQVIPAGLPLALVDVDACVRNSSLTLDALLAAPLTDSDALTPGGAKLQAKAGARQCHFGAQNVEWVNGKAFMTNSGFLVFRNTEQGRAVATAWDAEMREWGPEHWNYDQGLLQSALLRLHPSAHLDPHQACHSAPPKAQVAYIKNTFAFVDSCDSYLGPWCSLWVARNVCYRESMLAMGGSLAMQDKGICFFGVRANMHDSFEEGNHMEGDFLLHQRVEGGVSEARSLCPVV